PGELIGVPTGEASRFDVLDLDMDAGADEWLSEFCTSLSTTRVHHTRSGGYHWLFRHQPGLRNSASRLGPGVDVRAEGGYVIWWPATGLAVQNPQTIAAWPDWILEILAPQPVAAAERRIDPLPPIRSGRKYVAEALERACSSVANAREGFRNDALNGAVYGLARFVRTGELTGMEIAERLARAALDAGLESKEVGKTIASALKARHAA
ncbi:MAG: bifunctional DNA primase/polymerase, partial [Janthinobacterium lividum]